MIDTTELERALTETYLAANYLANAKSKWERDDFNIIISREFHYLGSLYKIIGAIVEENRALRVEHTRIALEAS